MHYLYILYSPMVNRFYIGSTSDIKHRLHQHNIGQSPYTRHKGPWYLVYSEKYDTKQQALQREKELKGWKSPGRVIETLGIDVSTLRQ